MFALSGKWWITIKFFFLSFFSYNVVDAVYNATIVAIGHVFLKKFWPLVIGCVLRSAGSWLELVIWLDFHYSISTLVLQQIFRIVFSWNIQREYWIIQRKFEEENKFFPFFTLLCVLSPNKAEIVLMKLYWTIVLRIYVRYKSSHTFFLEEKKVVKTEDILNGKQENALIIVQGCISNKSCGSWGAFGELLMRK